MRTQNNLSQLQHSHNVAFSVKKVTEKSVCLSKGSLTFLQLQIFASPVSLARAYPYKLHVLLLNSIFFTCVQKTKTDASFWGTLGMMNSMSV